MANTYTQLHIHFVFCVRNRQCLILPSWKEDLYKYITGIVQNRRHKLIAINGMPDHLHLLVGLHPEESISNLMRCVKGDSLEWINKKRFIAGKFNWQAGYGAFSCSTRNLHNIIAYIMNQEQHHTKKKFIEEYRELLKESGINYLDEYIFKPVD